MATHCCIYHECIRTYLCQHTVDCWLEFCPHSIQLPFVYSSCLVQRRALQFTHLLLIQPQRSGEAAHNMMLCHDATQQHAKTYELYLHCVAAQQPLPGMALPCQSVHGVCSTLPTLLMLDEHILVTHEPLYYSSVCW